MQMRTSIGHWPNYYLIFDVLPVFSRGNLKAQLTFIHDDVYSRVHCTQLGVLALYIVGI